MLVKSKCFQLHTLVRGVPNENRTTEDRSKKKVGELPAKNISFRQLFIGLGVLRHISVHESTVIHHRLKEIARRLNAVVNIGLLVD